MTLNEFINRRLLELGMIRSDLVNKHDLDWSTLSNITHGKKISKTTQEKLAKALQCTQGDIQACMAEQPSPFRKEAEMPEGQAGIGITAKVKRAKKVTEPEPEDEPAEVFDTESEDEDDEERPEYTHSEVKKIEQMARNDYQQQLRDMCLRIFATGIPGTHTMEKIYADIGYALVKELTAKEGDLE